MVIKKLANFKYILELNRKCEVINNKISAISTKHQVGKEEIRVKLKLYDYEIWDLANATISIRAWTMGKIDKGEMNKIEKVGGTALKRIFNLPISTS